MTYLRFSLLLAAFSFTQMTVQPIHASLISVGTVGDFALYDCGSLGSSAYLECQERMAQGEALYLATHTPVGIPWNPAYLANLPPPEQYHHYFVLDSSEDGRWLLIGDHDEDTDSRFAYVWHDGVFWSQTDPHVNVTAPEGANDWIAINDQGTIAGGNLYLTVYFGPLGYTNYLFACDWVVCSPGQLNDNNQLLVRLDDSGSWWPPPSIWPPIRDGDFYLFDPVPEPGTLVLFLVAFAFAIAARFTSATARTR